MQASFAYPGAAALLLFAQASLAEPVDLSDTTDRMIELEVVNSTCPELDPLCDAPGVYASDPAAEFVALGQAPIAFGTGTATITIPAAVWAEVLIGLFGESTDPQTEPGIVRSSVTDYLISIDTATGGPVEPRSWQADLIIEEAPGLPVELMFRATDTTRSGEFGAPPGTDYFFYDSNGDAISCVEWTFEAPPMGACEAADFRGDAPYDPQTGTLTFLGVVDNNFVPSLASPNFALTNLRIMEVPEPRAVLAQLAALGAVLLLGRFASLRS